MPNRDLQGILESHFEWFHRHPELSNQEHETTAHIREILEAAGIEILDAHLKTGLVARLRGSASEGPVVALRSDIDALSITEASLSPYPSEHPGVMHACGHDFHLTSLLGAALLLQKEQGALQGTIKLLFQPAEEGGNGAQQVLDSGVLDDVQEIYGLHTSAEQESGIIAVSPGAANAAVGAFRILLHGKGGHAAMPHLSLDPIPAAAQIVSAAQTIVSRTINPFDQAVLSITHIEAGSTWNVIPPEALLEGTIRTFNTEKLREVSEQLGKLARGIGESLGLRVEYSWQINTVATNNDPLLSGFVADTARGLGFPVVPAVPSMGGEDFALYQQRIPGAFWTIGVSSPQALHHPGFTANPAALSTAAELMAALGAAALQRLAG
jgi:amidohydrolase